MIRQNKVPYAIPQPNNMGVVRYILALYVLVSHFNSLAGSSIYLPVSMTNVVGGFFALSGFLLMGSYIRKHDFKAYLISRCRRLLPAYWTTVIIFALGLYFVSDAADYFTSSGFWGYLTANMAFLNFLHPTLPGVFDHNAIQAVNGSLWTMKVEWTLYLSVPFVAWMFAKWPRKVLHILLGLMFFSALYRSFFFFLYSTTEKEIYNILSRQFLGQLMYFYSGVLLYYFLDTMMKYKKTVIIVCVILQSTFQSFVGYQLTIEPLIFSTIVIWLSMVGRWATWSGRNDNVSYNIYLVHYPVIQLVAFFSLSQRWSGGWALLTSFVATVIIAILINQLVEKPIQNRLRHS